MVISIMFYDVPADPEGQEYEFGKIQISVSNIIVGIQASLLSIPVSTTVMTIFRYSRPRYIAVPDPLQAHSGSNISLLAGRMKNRVRRLTRYFSQQFHIHREGSDTSHGIMMDQIGGNSSINSSHSRSANRSSSHSSVEMLSKCPEPSSLTPRESVDKLGLLPVTTEELAKEKELVKLVNGDASNSSGSITSTSAIYIPEVNTSEWSKSTDSSSFENQRKKVVTRKQKSRIEAGDRQEEVVLNTEEFCNPLIFSAETDEKSDDFDDVESHVSVSERNVKNQDANGEVVLSSSWDLSDGTNMEYDTHQDYLCDKLNECREFFYGPPSAEFATEDSQKKACKKLNLILTMHGWEESSHKDEEEDEENTSDQGFLPWWCIYVAWALTISSSFACAFFIMQYGLRYGWQTSLDWLVAMLVSFIQSVVIVQPVKVIVLAIVFALTLKSHQVDDVGAQFFRNWKPPKSEYDLVRNT